MADSSATNALSYRSLGLIANPFRPRPGSTTEGYIGVTLSTHAAANRLIAVLDDLAATGNPRAVWVEKAGMLPAYYYVRPLAETLGVLGGGELGTDVLVCYVPMDQMRLGRARAALSVVAERVSGVDVDLTIATWATGVFAEPDTTLPEWDPIAGADLEGLREALAAAPRETIARYFGECVPEREGVDDLETLMRISTARQDALEVDPDEVLSAVQGAEEAAADEAPEGPLSEAFTTPLGPEDAQPEPVVEEAEPDDGLPRADELADYLVAHARAHLSPVIARGLLAYRAQGTSSMTEELKVSKAPTKTLAALCRFVTTRLSRVVFIYDRFDPWNVTPEDMRIKIVGTLSQLRAALRDTATFVVMAATDQVPEIEEQFGAAERIVWDMKGLVLVEGMDPPFVGEVAQEWLEAATIPGHEPPSLDSPPFKALIAEGNGMLDATAELLAVAIDDAAERGLDHVDAAAADAARLAVVAD